MEYLFTDWRDIEILVKDRRVMLFLDYDGTLTPIADRPEMATLQPAIKKMLKSMSKLKDLKIAIISGRSLKEIKSLVGISGFFYAGNHGLELEGPKIRHIHPSAKAFRRMGQNIASRLRRAYAFMPEILAENKTYTLSVHYRRVSEDKVAAAKMILLKEIRPYLKKSLAVLTQGKKVWEIRPPTQWDKGKIALFLLQKINTPAQKRIVPIYIGDDKTDESAFNALKKRGITVKVTDAPKERSNAHYFVRTPEDVFKFLQRFRNLKMANPLESAQNDK